MQPRAAYKRTVFGQSIPGVYDSKQPAGQARRGVVSRLAERFVMKATLIILMIVGAIQGSISFASGTVAKEKVSNATSKRVHAIDAELDAAK